MTSPAAPVDTGNRFLTETPCELATSLVQTPSGQRLAVTVRTSSATVTVLLAAPDAKAWALALTEAAARMSQSGLIIANGHVPPGG